MSMLSLRLTSEDEDAVRTLRRRGVVVSKVLRKALHDEAACTAPAARRRGELKAMLRRIYDEHPLPDGAPRRVADMTDRRAVAAAMRKHLSRKRKA